MARECVRCIKRTYCNQIQTCHIHNSDYLQASTLSWDPIWSSFISERGHTWTNLLTWDHTWASPFSTWDRIWSFLAAFAIKPTVCPIPAGSGAYAQLVPIFENLVGDYFRRKLAQLYCLTNLKINSKILVFAGDHFFTLWNRSLSVELAEHCVQWRKNGSRT